MDPTLTFVLQGVLAVMMLAFGFILNGMRGSMDQFRADLKLLNDAVLGKYVTREDSERWREAHLTETARKWEAQRVLDHDLRNMLQKIELGQAARDASNAAKEKAAEMAITTAKAAADAATAAAKSASDAAGVALAATTAAAAAAATTAASTVPRR